MSITRTPIVDDDGTGTTGTTLDNAWKQQLYDQIDAADAALGSSANAELIDVSAGGSFALNAAYGVHILRSTGSTTVTVAWTGGAAKVGERVTVLNNGTGIVKVAHNAGVIQNFVTSAATPIAAGGSATWIRPTTTLFVMTHHEQGAWITEAYNGANFVGNGSMTWTVDAGDQTVRYRLSGKTLTVRFQLATFSIGGTPNIALQIMQGAWGGFTAVGASGGAPSYTATSYLSDNATVGPGYSSANGTTFFSILKQAATNWTASTNNSYAYGSAELELV